MSNETINTITKGDYGRYESVRKSGVTNMYAIKTVAELSGLSREKVLAIMSNYEALMIKWPDVRKGS